MKNKVKIWSFMYYIFMFLIFIGLLWSILLMSSSVLKGAGASSDLGAIMAVTNAIWYIAIPLIIGGLMRFSLLKWYVDPFAAAEIPLFIYLWMLFNQMKHADKFLTAFKLVNQKLSNNGGEGWLFFVGLFVFGLIASFSIARKEGQSISYRLISKISKEY